MKTRRIRFTATAQDHVLRETAWWLANRDHADMFAEELEQAIKVVEILPGAGTPYALSPVPSVRRVYLRRVAAHLYYKFDEDEVIIRGARREHGPQLSNNHGPSPRLKRPMPLSFGVILIASMTGTFLHVVMTCGPDGKAPRV